MDKWLNNDQINHKLSNHFWKNEHVTDAQISQTLKFRYAQYMGNHRKHIFWPNTHQNPNCTLCQRHDKDTWPHLLSLCEHPHLKRLKISTHDKAVHLITQTLQANQNTRFYTLTNAGRVHNTSLDRTIPDWLLECTCPQTSCQCHAKLKPYIPCIIGAPNQSQTLLKPSPTTTIQLIEFTYCHDRFP